MTLNIKETIKNSNEFSKQNKPRSNSENFSLLGYNNKNSFDPKNINRKPVLLNKPQSPLNSINWDEPIEIETRDSDSINSESVSKKSGNKRTPRLYNFYEYLNKKRNSKNPEDSNNRSSLNSAQSISNYSQSIKSSPEYIYKLRRQISQDFEDSNSENLKYRKMPISSGFGGFTTTTRKINQPKPKKILPPKPQFEKPSQKIEIIESEPEEEIVHIIHKSRKNKKPKEQIVYVDEYEDEDQYPRLRQKAKPQEIMYVSRSPSPQPIKVVHSKEVNQSPRYVYAVPKPPKKQQIVYVKEPPSPVQYAYEDQDQDQDDMLPYNNSFSNNKYLVATKARKNQNYVYYDSQTPREKKIYYVDD